MSGKQERQNKLLDELKANKKLGTEQAAALLGVSLSSARRLFLELEQSGKAVRTYGGIQLVSGKGPDYSFEELEGRNIDEKKRIANCAVRLICNDDTVYFDSGTTLLQLAAVVRQKLQNGELKRIRVVTNSYANLQILNGCCEVVLIGGGYRAARKDFAGYAAERFVQCFNYKKAFLGADGFDTAEGFMATDADTAKLNEVVLRRSQESFVLMDSTKFGMRSFVSYAAAADAAAIVTDGNIAVDAAEACERTNVRVIRADD